MIVPDLARMMETITSPENYRSRPPSGPPIEYPVLTDEDLEAVSRTVYGQNLAMNNFALHSLKLFEDFLNQNLSHYLLQIRWMGNIFGDRWE